VDTLPTRRRTPRLLAINLLIVKPLVLSNVPGKASLN